MKEKILFESLSGSKLYGTDNENSDTDIKGVFLPDINDLILNKAPKHYTSTSNEHERNNKDDVDKTYYSLQYFLELAAKGETNAIDLLFAYTNKNAVLQSSPIWEKLIQNIDKILTKNVNAFLSYCKSQCIKYSIKGDKLDAYNALKDFLEGLINKNVKNKDGSWINLENALKEFNFDLDSYIDFEKKGKIIGKRAKIKNSVFGDHAYLVEMINKEKYLMISDMLFNFNESIPIILHKVNQIIKSYGKRAEIAMKENGMDYKAISHCVRVLCEVKELLISGRVLFPLKDAGFLKSIKFKTTSMTRDEIMNYIEKEIQYINNELLPNSKLPEKADYKWIENFILECYKDEQL